MIERDPGDESSDNEEIVIEKNEEDSDDDEEFNEYLHWMLYIEIYRLINCFPNIHIL